MTAIVTGATGFIGQHLVDALASAGDDVRCLTRGVPRPDPRPNVTVHQASYAESDLGLAPGVLDGVRVVYHLAGATKALSRSEFDAANVAATERLLDQVIEKSPRARFVYVSSQAAAGPAPDANHPKTEADAEAPIEDYGRSKLAAERAVRARADAIAFTIARPVAVYGPGDRDFLSIFSMARRGVAVYPGTRKSFINAAYVRDVVNALRAAADSPAAAGQTYFMGDDTPRSWKEIYSAIAAVMKQEKPVEVSVPRGVVTLGGAIGDVVGALSGRASLINSSKATLAAPKYWLCSTRRASRDFTLPAPVSLHEGMRLTYDWYLRHRWL